MESVSREIGGALLFGVLSFFLLSAAKKRGFFDLADQRTHWTLPLKWFHVVSGFAVYFGVGFLISPLFLKVLREWVYPGSGQSQIVPLSSWLNFFNSGLIFLCLLFYLQKLPFFRSLLRREKISVKEDIRMALYCWILSFPLVLFASQFLDLFIYFVFHVRDMPEQLAVYFLKMTFGQPPFFLMTVFTIVVLAPLIEETLFRGLLQSFIRGHLGSRQAIFITSLFFSLFHYSPEQGLSNLPIIGSLFILALFLGFIYEKRGSLLAPITLHASFNAVSVINLYFLGGFPKGPL